MLSQIRGLLKIGGDLVVLDRQQVDIATAITNALENMHGFDLQKSYLVPEKHCGVSFPDDICGKFYVRLRSGCYYWFAKRLN